MLNILRKLKPIGRNNLFRKKVSNPSCFGAVKINGTYFLKLEHFKKELSDEQIKRSFDSLCEKVLEHFEQQYVTLEKVSLTETSPKDSLVAAKVFTTFHDGMYLVRMGYFYKKEPYSRWETLFSHDNRSSNTYSDCPFFVPYTSVCGDWGEISFLRDSDFSYSKEFLFKVG